MGKTQLYPLQTAHKTRREENKRWGGGRDQRIFLLNYKAPDLKLDRAITILIPGNSDRKGTKGIIYWEEFLFTDSEDVRQLLALTQPWPYF